jgi:hypothetical protein
METLSLSARKVNSLLRFFRFLFRSQRNKKDEQDTNMKEYERRLYNASPACHLIKSLHT